MSDWLQDPLPGIAALAAALLALALLLALLRLVRGPDLPSRVVALELIGTLASGMIAVFAILQGQAVLLRAALVLALLSFLGTVAFAWYVEREKPS